MRDSVITDRGCFGNYHNKLCFLQPGCTQEMSYYENDEGPFHLPKEERQKQNMIENLSPRGLSTF
jgi:hypothetical protein